MKKLLYILALVLLGLQAWPAAGRDVLEKYNKVIWIDQKDQVGEAYGRGRKLMEFPIMSGDDETPTPDGVYPIKRKDPNYYSRRYKQPMPYSLFFDLKGMRAIHEGGVPEPEEKEEWATHGCIHVEEPYMKWLYDWADEGRTVVVIRGRRNPPPPEKPAVEEGREPEPEQEEVPPEKEQEDNEE